MNNADITAVEYITELESSFLENTLVFARASVLKERKGALQDFTDRIVSAVIMTDDDIPDDIASEFDNIATVPERFDMEKIMYDTRDIVQKSLVLGNRLQQLADIIASENDLTVIAQWISDFYGHPVNIVDASFAYLANSDIKGFEKFGSDELMKDIHNRYVSPDHIKKMQETQGYDLYRTSSLRPLLVYSPGEGFHQYHVPVAIGNAIAGAFSVYMSMDEDLHPLMQYYLTKISRLISIALQHMDLHTINKTSFYNSFFYAMLNGTDDIYRNWEYRVSAFGYRLLPSLHIAAVSFPGSITTRAEIDNLSATLHHIFPGSIYYSKGNMIYLLSSTKEGGFDAAEISSLGDDIFTRSDLNVGVSSEFSSIYDMHDRCVEAETALELGLQIFPGKRFYTYDSMRIYDMISRMTAGINYNSLCYPPFMKLFHHDRKNGTDYCQTLYCYLKYIKDPRKACSKLSIHKNTLYFRLNKIKEIMCKDITDISVSAQVFLSLYILRYMNEINENDPGFALVFKDQSFTEA